MHVQPALLQHTRIRQHADHPRQLISSELNLTAKLVQLFRLQLLAMARNQADVAVDRRTGGAELMRASQDEVVLELIHLFQPFLRLFYGLVEPGIADGRARLTGQSLEQPNLRRPEVVALAGRKDEEGAEQLIALLRPLIAECAGRSRLPAVGGAMRYWHEESAIDLILLQQTADNAGILPVLVKVVHDGKLT